MSDNLYAVSDGSTNDFSEILALICATYFINNIPRISTFLDLLRTKKEGLQHFGYVHKYM